MATNNGKFKYALALCGALTLGAGATMYSGTAAADGDATWHTDFGPFFGCGHVADDCIVFTSENSTPCVNTKEYAGYSYLLNVYNTPSLWQEHCEEAKYWVAQPD